MLPASQEVMVHLPSFSIPSLKLFFPDWLRMRLEGDKINNLDKFLIPN